MKKKISALVIGASMAMVMALAFMPTEVAATDETVFDYDGCAVAYNAGGSWYCNYSGICVCAYSY